MRRLIPLLIVLAVSSVVYAAYASSTSTDFYGLRCWERACIAGDEAWRRGRKDEAKRFYMQASAIARSHRLGAERLAVSDKRVDVLQADEQEAMSETPRADDQPTRDQQVEQEELRAQIKQLGDDHKYTELIALAEPKLKSAPLDDYGFRIRLARELSDAYNRTGAYEKSVQVLTPMLHEEAFHKNSSDFNMAMKSLLHALSKQGAHEQALKEANLLVRVISGDPLHKPLVLASALRSRGNVYMKLARFDAAAKEYQAAINEVSEDQGAYGRVADYYRDMARALDRGGHPEEAVRALNDAAGYAVRLHDVELQSEISAELATIKGHMGGSSKE